MAVLPISGFPKPLDQLMFSERSRTESGQEADKRRFRVDLGTGQMPDKCRTIGGSTRVRAASLL